MSKRLLVMSSIILLAACQSTSDGSKKYSPEKQQSNAASGEVVLTATELIVNKALKPGIPYPATIKYAATGEGAQILRGCFTWSGEGPYCFEPISTATGEATWRLRTNNPNVYKLAGSVEYRSAGGTRRSNFVSAIIDVQ